MRKIKKLPRVLFSKDVTMKAMKEVDKFFQLGIQLEKTPWEAAMYPMASLVLKNGIHKSPLEFIDLNDIEVIVITQVFYPPNKCKDYSSGHAGFKNTKIGNAMINQKINTYIHKYPLIDAFCKMHSHTGNKSKFLSSGDIKYSILNAYTWFRNKGLNTMLSIVMTPQKSGWNFTPYGLNSLGRNIKLPVEIVSRNHYLVLKAKSQPYYETQNGSNWCDDNKAELIKLNYDISRNILRRGWRRYTVKINNKMFIICIPPFFPEENVKVFKIVNSVEEPFQKIVLPKESIWSSINKLNNYHIVELIEVIKTL